MNNFCFNPLTQEGMKSCDDIILQLKHEGYSKDELTDYLMKCVEPGCEIERTRLFEKIRHRWSVIRQGLPVDEKSRIDEAVRSRHMQNQEQSGGNGVTEDDKREFYDVSCDGRTTSQKVFDEDDLPDVISLKDEGSARKILEMHNLNPDEFELRSVRVSKWEVSDKDSDSTKTLASLRITAAVKQEEVDFKKWYRDVIKQADEYSRADDRPHVVPMNKGDGSKMLILPLADFHLDKREPGIGKPSFAEQKKRFFQIIGRTEEIAQSYGEQLGRIVFFWSQDFFNYDYMDETTTSRKNKQDAGVGWETMTQHGNAMLISAVERLEQYAPVEIVYTRANHDQHTSFMSMISLWSCFRHDPNVIIDGCTSDIRRKIFDRLVELSEEGKDSDDKLFSSHPRKYIKWGKCLFGFAHGDKEGKRIVTSMQNEAAFQLREQYALANDITDWKKDPYNLPSFEGKFPFEETFVHTFFCGHFHSKQVLKDDGGVEVIYCGTDMTGDNWHNECGYVGARRRVEVYVYDKNGDYNTYGIHSQNL